MIGLRRKNMLSELHISNFAVIEDTKISFTSNYTALVGETGSGKSLIVSALLLLNGERSDFSLLRNKEKKAYVEALFTLSEEFIKKHSEVKEYVLSDNSLLIKRVLNPDKSNRIYINDEMVTLNELKKISKHLLNIHSQNSNSEIYQSEKQLSYIDFFDEKNINFIKEKYQSSYQEYKDKLKEKEELLISNKELDRDYLLFQIKEIEKYDLKENEIEDLNEEFLSLRQYDIIKQKYEAYDEVVNSSTNSLYESLSQASMRLKGFKDTPLEEKANKIFESVLSLQDELSSFEDSFKSLNFDPNRIDSINERLFKLKDLQRKYGKTTKEILSKYHDFKNKLSLMDDFEGQIALLDQQIKAKEDEVITYGRKLTEARKKASLKLAKEIGKEMCDVGLRKNAFEIAFEENKPTIDGLDKVTFLVTLNEGLEKETIQKATSGGEASRLMLALKIALNRLDPYDFIIFDEIDTGISGKIASLVAKKIQSLKDDSSILVISHLPQVVASSYSAIEVSKVTKNNMTYSTTKELSIDELYVTIGKMLSGDKVNDAAINAAKELYMEYHQ